MTAGGFKAAADWPPGAGEPASIEEAIGGSVVEVRPGDRRLAWCADCGQPPGWNDACDTCRKIVAWVERRIAAKFPPPPLDAPRCDGCGAVSTFASWSGARAAGWSSGTAASGEVATFCPACEPGA